MVSLIGFKPKNIVLYGDSAGSNLAVSLMHVLKSLNELLLANNSCRDEGTCNNNFADPHTIIEKSFQIPYPSSVFLLYPFMSPTVTRFTPSRLFMAFDPVLPLGSLFALSEAYHPPSSKPHHHYAHSHESQNGAKDPWYRKGSCGCSQQRLEEIQYSNLGHFFNPLCGKFDDFKATPLYIQVGEFDPLFDDAVCLAKKWKGEWIQKIEMYCCPFQIHDSPAGNDCLKHQFLSSLPWLWMYTGPVKFEMMEGLTHGYLFNGVFSSACKKAIDLCNERLLQAIFPHDSTLLWLNYVEISLTCVYLYVSCTSSTFLLSQACFQKNMQTLCITRRWKNTSWNPVKAPALLTPLLGGKPTLCPSDSST